MIKDFQGLKKIEVKRPTKLTPYKDQTITEHTTSVQSTYYDMVYKLLKHETDMNRIKAFKINNSPLGFHDDIKVLCTKDTFKVIKSKISKLLR